jgi:hypothetical protein
MNSKIVFAAVSLALVLNGASAAIAGGKKELVDPRTTAKSATKTKQGWCEIDPKCNGWGAWEQGVIAGKKFKG